MARTLRVADVAKMLALVAATLVGLSACGGKHPITVKGSLVVSSAEAYPEIGDKTGGFGFGAYDVGHPCLTDNPRDVENGTQVVIADDAGRTLALTELTSGYFDDQARCDFYFTAKVPSGKHFYGIKIGQHPVVKFTEQDMRSPEITAP